MNFVSRGILRFKMADRRVGLAAAAWLARRLALGASRDL